MTALERAARAAINAIASEKDFVEGAISMEEEGGLVASYVDVGPVNFIELARAVLMAVRELPDEILNEHLYDNEYGYAMYYEGWQPAIDAILNEKDTTND